MKRALSHVALLALLGCLITRSASADETLRLTVKSTANGGANVPVMADITLAKAWAEVPADNIAVTMQGPDGASVPGQVVKGVGDAAQLWWILPAAKAGETASWTATLSRSAAAKDGFAWQDTAGDHLDLRLGGRIVTRFMYAYDTATPQRAHETFKPFLHVFDAAGQEPITKGPGGLYTHHRGLFIGWMKVGSGGQSYDEWHMKGVAQVHQKFLQLVAGPVLARSTALIHWNDKAGKPVIIEERETTVFRQPAPAVAWIDFHPRLKPAQGDVTLDGDLEHAGIHYRPSDDAGKTPEQIALKDAKPNAARTAATFLFPKDGIDGSKTPDLPWVGMHYTLHGHDYSVQHMNHPDNPKGTVYSAHRDYGRFGAFFKKAIKAGETLDLRYRIGVTEGAMPARDDMTARWTAFANPPQVEVVP